MLQRKSKTRVRTTFGHWIQQVVVFPAGLPPFFVYSPVSNEHQAALFSIMSPFGLLKHFICKQLYVQQSPFILTFIKVVWSNRWAIFTLVMSTAFGGGGVLSEQNEHIKSMVKKMTAKVFSSLAKTKHRLRQCEGIWGKVLSTSSSLKFKPKKIQRKRRRKWSTQCTKTKKKKLQHESVTQSQYLW